MDLITPAIGLVFWTSLTFLILLVILKKVAWKPILNAVKEREESIENALQAADKAKQEMASLQASNEALLKEAREERDNLLKEAKDVRDNLIAEAKGKAKEEADKIMSSARESIETEKNAAMAEIRNQVAELSLAVAEKILRENLSSDEKQKDLVNKYIDEINLN